MSGRAGAPETGVLLDESQQRVAPGISAVIPVFRSAATIELMVERVSEALEKFKGEIVHGVRPDVDRHLTLGDYLAIWLTGRRGRVGSGLRESTWRENDRHGSCS